MIGIKDLTKKVLRIFGSLFGWLCFVNAVISLIVTPIRYAMGQYSGFEVEAIITLYIAVCFTIWWRIR